MLTSLSIKNYALIDDIQVQFDKGLIIITGETGAGKSILLGGLSLILGKRADLSILKNKHKKCVIEAEFAIGAYQLSEFFTARDIDFDEKTIIRREILPEGKSRAFINDTPANLNTLSALASQLLDIHSQHETLQLTDDDFQFKIVDAVAGNDELLRDYRQKRSIYHQTKKTLQKRIDFQKEAEKEYDYNSFLMKELQEADLREGVVEELEAVYEKLNNTEEIQEKLSHAAQLLGGEQLGILTLLAEVKQAIHKLSAYGKSFNSLHNRITSTYIELDDALSEIQQLQETIDSDPQYLEEVHTKLQRIYDLQKKHNVLTVTELLQRQARLEESISVTENLEAAIKESQLQVFQLEEELDTIAQALHENRKKAIPGLTGHIETTLGNLGIKNAQLKIDITKTQSYLSNGKDTIAFLFSANKGAAFGKLSKTASGGELSRIMLSVKALLATYTKLPTIIFDEIDTGVSGKVADKVGEIIKQMSTNMQVIAITHLPQIAAKGNTHFKIYKEEASNNTHTAIKRLHPEDRVIEIAEMIDGKDKSASALMHAKNLLSS